MTQNVSKHIVMGLRLEEWPMEMLCGKGLLRWDRIKRVGFEARRRPCGNDLGGLRLCS